MSGPVETPTKKGAKGKKAGTDSVKFTPKKTPKAKAGTKRKHDEVEEDEAKVKEEEESMGGPVKTPTEKKGRIAKAVDEDGHVEGEGEEE